MIRMSAPRAGAAFLAVPLFAVLLFSASHAYAQQAASATQTPDAQAPAAPAAAPVFPAPSPSDFTADSPTKEIVNAFMQANLGFDENSMWQVQAIQKTPVQGISRVLVYIGDKTGKVPPYAFAFFVTPDGKHIIAGDKVIPFGDRPYAEDRTMLQQKANGPYRGTASKDLEIVEFADFQCPHCKAAQANMEKLVADFPKARIVFQNEPLVSVHPESLAAAEYGTCVAKAGGSTAFFQFASAVFDGQDGLASPDGATLTLNSAVTKAGLDPAKVAACAAAPETKADVDASLKLSQDLNIASVPTLVINGRQVPANAPYETLKRIIEYQAKLDGVAAE